MTVAVYALGKPLAATLRGGDCRARDLAQARNVFGPHRFAATTDCRISNGLLRLTVGASGAAPAITVEAFRPAVTVGDLWNDVYVDVYPGSLSTPAWQSMGTVTVDSPAVAALFTSLRIVQIKPAAVTIRLVSAAIGDAFVTLRRGFRTFEIQHGSTRGPLVTTTRRVTWTASPSPTGSATTNRVEEQTPVIAGFPRFLGSLSDVTVNAGAFSLTSPSLRSVIFGAGVGTDTDRDRTADQHAQLADASTARLVIV